MEERSHEGGSIYDARPIDPVSRQKGSAGDPLRALALSPRTRVLAISTDSLQFHPYL